MQESWNGNWLRTMSHDYESRIPTRMRGAGVYFGVNASGNIDVLLEIDLGDEIDSFGKGWR